MQYADGVYDRTKPWQSNEERMVGEALGATANMSADQIQALRPPTPARLFPDRFGYEQRALSVRDCFALTTRYGDARDNYSRVTSGYQGSSTPALGVM